MKRVSNPPNPYETQYREWLGEPPRAKVQVYEERAKSILSENDSPDLPFRWSVNPYRGCQHACAYCYARPYHEYLGLGAGTDFETQLIVKTNAADLLRTAFAANRWRGESVNFSGVTDCYQPLEAVYSITRSCLETCLRFANPAAVVTKSYLVMRDAELLSELNRRAGAMVYQSVPFANDRVARLIESQAPPPSRRFEAMRRLSAAGVPVGVLIAPIIPGLNDVEIPLIIERAAAAGARWAGYVPLRLPGSVRPVFLERLREALPARAALIEGRIRDMRGGDLSDSRFGARMRGQGVYWKGIQALFDLSLRRHGLQTACDCRPWPRSGTAPSIPPEQTPPCPSPNRQLLFDFTPVEDTNREPAPDRT